MGNIDWGFTFAVVIVGLVVVFVVLILLVLLCTLMGLAFKAKNKEKKAPEQKIETTKKAEVVKPAAPVIESGISNEVVAAISAAVYAVMGDNKPFAIKSVKRTRDARPAWNTASIAENTRPF